MKFDLQYYETLPSTNIKAVKNIQDGTAHGGMVIWAGGQTQGKGTGSNSWESEKGKNLTFSLLVEPRFLKPAEQFVLTQLISIAIYETLAKILPSGELFIKWPNDIYYQKKKICGVLIQNYVKGQEINFAVIGVGINVNQTKFLSDAPNPASLIHFTGKETDLPSLLDEILRAFEKHYDLLNDAEKRQELHRSYLRHLYLRNQWENFSDESGTFGGKITGVNDYGQLLIEDREGNRRTFGFNEIKLE